MREMEEREARYSGALKPIDTVVIGTSLAKESDDLLKAGLDLAHTLGAKAYVAHAAPLEPLSPRFGAGWAESDYFREFTRLRWDELRHQLERVAPPAELKVEPLMRTDTPHLVVTSIAGEVGADLVIVGASETPHGLGRLLGSTSERVLRKAPCPVLVLRKPSGFPWRRVLAPVDLSVHSADSLRCGVGFLSQLAVADAAVKGLLVLTDFQRQALEDFTSPGRVEAFASHELERFVDDNLLHGPGAVGTGLRTGDPRAEILAEAEEWGADLIVIGTHGRGGLERALIGSVASGVAAGATAAVLVIPPMTALGASIGDAVLEQTGPHWPEQIQPGDTDREEGSP